MSGRGLIRLGTVSRGIVLREISVMEISVGEIVRRGNVWIPHNNAL